jgi:hypothetical protein
MEKKFRKFSENIRLTENQESDAKTKYTGVCKKLHDSYYGSEYDGSTKFLFGSYKTRTNVRPLTEDQDVDVLFKIPEETYKKFRNYEGNGPSALLQEIRGFLKEKYTTTDKISAWGKVVLVVFQEKNHNVEVLPAYEEEDGTFTIPNSEDGGRWEPFNPKKDLDEFHKSNNATNKLTADMTRMIKTWVRNTATCNYKSYKALNDVIQFLKKNWTEGADYADYSAVMLDFFKFIKNKYSADDDLQSHTQTAFNRAEKANGLEKDGKMKEASEEWRKIFGTEFPLAESNPQKNDSSTRVFSSPSRPYGYY